MPFTTIICDEATRLSNIRNKQYKALKKIKSQFRIAATGSPVQNSPTDIFGILDWVQPGSVGSWWNFMNNFIIRNAQGWIIGSRNLKELAQRIKPLMIRRLRSEVLELPELITIDVPVVLGLKERKLYDSIKRGLLFDLEKLEVNKIKDIPTLDMSIVKFGKLRELCLHMSLLGEGTDSAKLAVLKDLLQTLEGSKVILFTAFSRMADILASEIDCLKITGAVSMSERNTIIDKFNSTNGIILVGTKAIFAGLNLQSSNVIINYDPSLSLSEEQQKLGRIERYGQTQKMLCYNLIVENSVEKVIAKKLAKKQDMSKLLLAGTGSLELIKEILDEDELPF